MTTSQLPTEETSVVRVNLNGKLHRITIKESDNVDKLRAVLKHRFDLPNTTYFLDNDGCQLHIDDEVLITIKQLLTKEQFVRLSTEIKPPILMARSGKKYFVTIISWVAFD